MTHLPDGLYGPQAGRHAPMDLWATSQLSAAQKAAMGHAWRARLDWPPCPDCGTRERPDNLCATCGGYGVVRPEEGGD